MKILSPRETCAKLGIGRTTLWSRSKTDPNFPRPVELSPGRIGFVDREIDAFIERLIAARDAGRAA